jgi:hypothetical protein
MGKHHRLYYPAGAGFVAGPGKQKGIDQNPALADENNKEIRRNLNNMTNRSIPYFDNNGSIIIPFNFDQKYHFWNGGQPVSENLMVLNAPEHIWSKHTVSPYPGDAA